MFDLKN